MKNSNVLLAEHPGLGRIRICECDAIHVNIGPITINLEPSAFLQMTSMMCSAMEKLAAIRRESGLDMAGGEMPEGAQNRIVN
jgi:hypothetical protein